MVYIINYIYVAVPFRMSGSTPVIDGEHVQAYTIGTIRNKINAIIFYAIKGFNIGCTLCARYRALVNLRATKLN